MVFRVCVKCMHAFFCNKAPIYLYSCPYMCHKCKISSGNTAGFSINAEVINNLKLGWEIWSIFTCRLKYIDLHHLLYDHTIFHWIYYVSYPLYTSIIWEKNVLITITYSMQQVKHRAEETLLALVTCSAHKT